MKWFASDTNGFTMAAAISGWAYGLSVSPMSWISAQKTYSSSWPWRSARVAVCRLCSSRSTGKPPWSASSSRKRLSTRSATSPWVISSWGAMIAQSSAVDSSNEVKLARGCAVRSVVPVMETPRGWVRDATAGSDPAVSTRSVLDGPPHLLGGGGHVDVADAEMAHGVDHGGLHRRGGPDRARLADALRRERVHERGRLHVDHLEARQFGGRDHGVVGQVRRDGVAVLVVAPLLEQCLRGALGDPAVDLPVEQQRIEHAAGVVAGDLAQVTDLPGAGVDLDHRHVGAERERGLLGRVRGGDREFVVVGTGRDGQVGPRLGHRRRPGHVEGAGVLVEHHVGLVGLEQLGGELARRVDQFGGGLIDGHAALLQRAGPHRATADG